MQFSFIKYTQPGWTFNVRPEKAMSFASCDFHPDLLPVKGMDVQEDEDFEIPSARYADIGYRAFNKGCLTWADKTTRDKIDALPKPSLKDEYTFIFKYWGKPWALLALMQRLLTLHNPFSEIAAYLTTASKKRINPYDQPVVREDYTSFSSTLVQANPAVAVIIPTLNRYGYLKDVLEDLEKQDYKNFEVIVVDQSSPFQKEFYDKFDLRLNVIHQKERLLWTARNNAVKATDAEYLLFFDDDSRVDADWITQHLKCLDHFSCDISAGVSLAKVGMKIPQSYNYFRWADQFDSGNALVKRSVFKKIGMFDLNFNKQSMGDGEFGIRAYTNGIKSMSNPFAKRIHLKVSAGGLREIGHWDGFRPKKWFAPKPIPSVVYLYKKYYSATLSRHAILLGIMLSNISYKNKKKPSMLVLSLFLTVVKAPLLYVQYRKSLKKANAMLAGGDKIEALVK